ncbi:MAG: NAD(P)/FAD-dependent oxidoreductase [Leptospiraceae bacterium]|nr:NAD(P)/FAD-dependent oxidoreductase [Leptospiraceae bacterium]
MNIGILGGGAAGYFGAIQIAKLLKGKANIILLEKGEEPLTKVKISGGGRCNVTHNLFDPVALSEKYPRGAKELRAAFARFQPKDTVAWFESHGVNLKAEADGRMFPITNSSSTIIDCLTRETKKEGVDIRLNTVITAIYVDNSKEREKFCLVDKEENNLYFDKLLVATGSNRKVWNWLEALGHTIEKPVPSLFTLHIPDPRLKDLPGLSVPSGEIRLLPKGKPQLGPILITHWGLSGPAVLRLSAWEAHSFAECDYKANVKVNWLGEMNKEKFLSHLTAAKQDLPAKKISTNPQLGLATRLWESFLRNANINLEKRWSEISNAEMNRLSEEVCSSIYEVNGKSIFKDEFVTAGGVKRKEVDFTTMESKIISGLYFAGEVLDIDGITGGFNFQNAWTTSWIAAGAIANA